MNEIKTKVCACCGKELPITEFYKNSATKDGLDPYCKECKKESNRKGQEKRKDRRSKILELEKENQELRNRILSNRSKDLASYEGRELLAELKKRGYVWEDMFVRMQVDYAKI